LEKPPPTKPFVLSMSGSRRTMSLNCASLTCIAWNEVSWSAWIVPVRRPASCCGKNPFGTFA
jgi:hypothetical protein